MSLKFLLLSLGRGSKNISMTFQQLQNPIFAHGLEVFEVRQGLGFGIHDLSISGA